MSKRYVRVAIVICQPSAAACLDFWIYSEGIAFVACEGADKCLMNRELMIEFMDSDSGDRI